MKSAVLFLCCFAAIPALAARQCSQGNGSDRLEMPGGYVAQVAASTDKPGQCRASITTQDGKTVYELTDREIALNPISGKDVNGDGKPDAVIETHPARGACCWNYYVVTPGEEQPLLRQFATSVPLNFEDKLGDGKVEIWTRDFAFDGVDGFPHSESPFPLIFFRMKGANIYNVSQLFWTDYQREIEDAKNGISKEDAEALTKEEGENAKPPQEGDPKAIHLRSVRALVLTVVLDYLYADRGPDAWKTISEMWPILDRQRIRQLILRNRMRGILSEINRTPAPTTAKQ